MIPCLESGISGFDELTRSKNGRGGIPENSSTLIYGPVKTGKTIFSSQFAYQGLINSEPCLYITTDQGIQQFETMMFDFRLPIEKFIVDKSMYVIDTTLDISDKIKQTENIISSYINKPTDIMVKVCSGVHYVYKNNPRFRSVLDYTVSIQ